VEVVNRPRERRRRGVLATEDARARFSWPALAREVAGVYDAARGVEPAELLAGT
jgi:hypothetical protein